jgi:hypothetical protein
VLALLTMMVAASVMTTGVVAAVGRGLALALGFIRAPPHIRFVG